MKKYILENADINHEKLYYLFEIYGTKKPSTLKNKILIQQLQAFNKNLTCFMLNQKTNEIKRYTRYDSLINFKKNLIENNPKSKFYFCGINFQTLIINFFSNEHNHESKLLLIQIPEHIEYFGRDIVDQGYNILRSTSLKRVYLIDLKNSDPEELLFYIKLQYDVETKDEIFSLNELSIDRISF